MLINAQRPEELRIAVVQGNSLENYQVDVAESGQTRGNIYRGVIASIQPSLNAAFIDYGAERHGFLAIQDVVPEAYYHHPRGGQPRIEEVLEKNKPIVVQVAKDPVSQKGAALTTSLSLAGRYLVLTPFDDTRGVSRKVEDEDTRKKLKTLANGLDLPSGCGVIVRTNALDQNKTTLSRDFAALLRLWKRVQTAALEGKGTRLLYTDQDIILQALRDYLDSSIDEVLVDDDEAFLKAKAYMQAFMPRAKTRLTRYSDRLPLFSRYDIEPQVDRIYQRRVELPSGGSIVIDATEALTAIDVNSGRSTRAATQEETAVHTNLEAAIEVARQLRLRDIGGLVVVDFIDMRASKNQRKVEKTLRDTMKIDKARASIGKISPNGLLEINRQRIHQALQLRTHRPCPTCDGVGRLASEEMVALSILRRIEARAASGLIQGVRIGLHPELADALQNSRRKEMADLEDEFDIKIEVIAAPGLHRPEERIEWYKREKPVPPPRPRPAPVTLQAWDLALPEPDEDEDEIEAEEAAAPAPRAQRAPRAAAAPNDGGSGDPATETEAQRRRRRRGGRKRRKTGGEGRVASSPAPAGVEIAEDHFTIPVALDDRGGHDSHDSHDHDGGDDDFEAADGEDFGGEGEGGEEIEAGVANGTGNGVGNRRRRRRRRRK
jgi:ribonuclease E